jgi:hypothetical protein
VHDELGVKSFKLEERLAPEFTDEAGSARYVVGVERVTDWHKQVEPNLRARSDEDSPATASSPHEIGTEGSGSGLVDRSEGLRAAEHDGWPIRVAKSREATRRIRGDDELAGS